MGQLWLGSTVHMVEVSLGRILDPKLLPIGMAEPFIVAATHWCIRVPVKRVGTIKVLVGPKIMQCICAPFSSSQVDILLKVICPDSIADM